MILNEEGKYDRMKENLRSVSGKQKNIRLNSVHSIP